MKIGITCYPTYGGSGVVATELGIELKEKSPYKNTFIITHCNGSAGYLVTDKALKEDTRFILSRTVCLCVLRASLKMCSSIKLRWRTILYLIFLFTA